MRALHHRRRRGQAITEFALVVPVLIVILLYSMYFEALVHAKLKLQEASRYAAWEMTSYALDNYGNTDHAQAFALAQAATIADANQRFEDLESIDDRATGGFVVGYRNVRTQVTNLDAALPGDQVPRPVGNPFVNGLLGLLGGSLSKAQNTLKFNTRGKVQVEVTMQLENRILPHHFLDERGTGFFKADVWGGRNLQNVALKNRFTLIASGWALPDGADAEQHQKGAGAPRAGVHRGGSDSGLYTQVHRMHLFGAPDRLPGIQSLKPVLQTIGNFIPDPVLATYVVSHNYFADKEPGIKDRGCNQDPGHGAQWGMNNLNFEKGNDSSGLRRNDGPGLDYDRRKCYDTAPFRDTSSYGDSHGRALPSLYREIYMARGAYFMGCKKDQADNPSQTGLDPYAGKDQQNKKVSCE